MKSKKVTILKKLAEYAVPSAEISIETRVNSIPSNVAFKPNIAVGIFLQEAFNIFTYAQEDKEVLCSKGLDLRLLEELPKRIDFAREMEARWYTTRYSEVPSARELNRIYVIVDASRKGLLAGMEYAFFGDNLARAVAYIKKGEGSDDYTQDLWDITQLAEEYVQELTDVGCDLKQIEILNEYKKEYAELVARCNVEEKEKSYVRLSRDKAYTFLVIALEEIRRAARHAFWNDKKRLRGYASEYFRKSTRKQSTKD